MIQSRLTFWGILSLVSLALQAWPIHAKPVVPTVLISIDGFSQYYMRKFDLPVLSSLAKDGVEAEALIPVFPSKTFPNHISIVTGVYPTQHGIIGNAFYRQDVNQIYSMGLGKHDSRWLTAKPIWAAARQQGLTSAIYYWPESEAKVDGILPNHFFYYQDDTPNQARVNQVKEWLSLPQPDRPHFIALYFSLVDSAGHDYGRHSTQLKAAVMEADRLLGDLTDFVQKHLSGEVNLVIVSDHGMTQISQQKLVYWNDYITPAKGTVVVEQQTQLMIYSQDIAEVSRFVKAFSTLPMKARTYVKGQFPLHWHWHRDPHNRLPDVVVDLPPPWTFSSIEDKQDRGQSDTKIYVETHGYDPHLHPEMDAIFIAHGPAFKQGVKLERFENIHVYALLEKLLGLNPAEHLDASLKFTEAALVD